MEHLNRVAKNAIQSLGANKTEKAIERVGRAIGTIASLLQAFDAENQVNTKGQMSVLLLWVNS